MIWCITIFNTVFDPPNRATIDRNQSNGCPKLDEPQPNRWQPVLIGSVAVLKPVKTGWVENQWQPVANQLPTGFDRFSTIIFTLLLLITSCNPVHTSSWLVFSTIFTLCTTNYILVLVYMLYYIKYIYTIRRLRLRFRFFINIDTSTSSRRLTISLSRFT